MNRTNTLTVYTHHLKLKESVTFSEQFIKSFNNIEWYFKLI